MEDLRTAADIATAVTILTQIIKRHINIDPKLIALVLSIVITVVIQMIEVDFSFQTIIQSLLNSILTAGASIGAYEAVFAPAIKDIK